MGVTCIHGNVCRQWMLETGRPPLSTRCPCGCPYFREERKEEPKRYVIEIRRAK